MYIYQNGKLYVHAGNNKLVGVEIYPNKVVRVKGTETIQSDNFQLLTKHEVRCKFQIELTPYIFPQDKPKKEEIVKEVKKVESTPRTKSTTRKSTSK